MDERGGILGNLFRGGNATILFFIIIFLLLFDGFGTRDN